MVTISRQGMLPTKNFCLLILACIAMKLIIRLSAHRLVNMNT
jgi:hypothetical protein